MFVGKDTRIDKGNAIQLNFNLFALFLEKRSSILTRDMFGVHLIVSGLVQGVGFRYFVYRKALEYKLGGWVKNLATGEVEIMALGDRGLLETLIADVKVGNRSAIVRDLIVKWIDVQEQYSGFEIR